MCVCVCNAKLSGEAAVAKYVADGDFYDGITYITTCWVDTLTDI